MASYSNIVQSSNTRFVALPKEGPYDLYVQGVFSQNFEGLMSFRLGETSAKTSGLMKLSHQYLSTLLTTPGSDLFEPTKGTQLASLIGGNFYDPEQLRIVIRESVIEASRQVVAQQSLYRPINADEILRSATLKSLTIVGTEAFPYILLISAAGRFANVKLPGINVQ